jgi:hypothetical protein
MTSLDQTGTVALAPVSSLADLRRLHSELLQAVQRGGDPSQFRADIQQFIQHAQGVGRYIDREQDRDAAQGILDYWVARLLTAEDPVYTPFESRVLDEFDALLTPDLSEASSPFRGLDAFREHDAGQFFGRDEEVAALASAVTHHTLLAVYGPSGSGKSSLVLAGLIPSLRHGAAPGSEAWRYLRTVVPGTDPLAALVLAARPESTDPGEWVAEHRPGLERSAAYLRDLLAAGAESSHGVLVVDQFEEIFTLCGDPNVRDRFAEAIAQVTAGPNAPARAVLVVREDFLARVRRLAAFSGCFNTDEATFLVPPLSPRELRRVIEEPAAAIGLRFEDGIVDELVSETIDDPAALPLLQFTLQRLWERRDRSRITRAAYRAVGAPREALKRAADELYEKSREHQGAVERIFGELVQPDVGAEYVRRRVRREVLVKLEAPYRVNDTLNRLVAAGLVRMTPGFAADDDRFEVVHEALIRNWPKLGEWLQESRRLDEKRLRLQSVADMWIASGREGGYLLSGDALAEARLLENASPQIQEFVQASASGKRRANRNALVLLCLVVFTLIYFGVEQNNALKLAHDRLQAQDRAIKARDSALAQLKIALDSQKIAERQTTEAVSGAAEAISRLASARARTQRTGGAQVSATIQHIITESKSGGRNFWPNGSTLKVKFLDGDSAIHARVARYAGEWSRYANIRFDFAPTPGERADIRITFAAPVSWSLIGTQARDAPPQEPTMNLGAAAVASRPAETRRLVLYEFGHALGLVHELQNPQADIPWDTAAVLQYFARRYGYTERMVRENVLQKYDSSIGYHREFDPTSLMHAFRIPAVLTHGRYDIHPGREVSDSDKRLIGQIYPTPGSATR